MWVRYKWTVSTLVAGVDSSTQSTKVVVCDAATGAVVRESRASHPHGTQVDPEHWWNAWQEATAGGLLDGVEAVAVAGQQHGLVTLDESRAIVRDALLWNDTRSAAAAYDLIREAGGPRAWADATGSVPSASFTVAKLRWLAHSEPDHADRVRAVVLPHDWLTARMLGDGDLSGVSLVTDRGDASGTGYWSPAQGAYRPDLLALALGRPESDLPDLPEVLAPGVAAGRAPSGRVIASGTGDNMGAALGLSLGPGDIVVSLGTSGTVFGVADRPTADPTGTVAGFADATGQFLPLVCTLNAARVLTAAAAMLGTDLVGLDRLALAAEPGAGGLTLLPYLDGERTPVLPTATGTLGGITRVNTTPENFARAAVEGMLCSLADGLDALREQGAAVRRVLLVGGAARSAAVQEVARGLFGAPVQVPAPGEYVALGAARQAAWALSEQQRPPDWKVSSLDLPPEPNAALHMRAIRDSYGHLRHQMHGA